MTDPVNKAEALKPCPFCGGDAGIYESDTVQGNFDVLCMRADCGGMAVASSREDAITAWNRRAALPEAPAVPVVKALEWYTPATSTTLSRCDTILGIYRVWSHHEANGRWFWSLDGYEKQHGATDFDNEATAKAAAQADFEKRIRSALQEQA